MTFEPLINMPDAVRQPIPKLAQTAAWLGVVTAEALVKGDGRVFSIAAASCAERARGATPPLSRRRGSRPRSSTSRFRRRRCWCVPWPTAHSTGAAGASCGR